MQILRNTGTDRVLDAVRPALQDGHRLDLASPTLSLFAFEALATELKRSLWRPRSSSPPLDTDLGLLGSDADRAARNRLQAHALARRAADWLASGAEVRARARTHPPGDPRGSRRRRHRRASRSTGSFALSTDGLGLTPGNPLALVQASETPGRRPPHSAPGSTRSGTRSCATPKRPSSHGRGGRTRHRPRAPARSTPSSSTPSSATARTRSTRRQIVRSATGIRDTVVWNKLYAFQRDGVVAAIDKLARYGGCIIADSVGLGKTFEALAVIKYHELRNDRVLVLCPKRLRDNWTLYAANDRRNVARRRPLQLRRPQPHRPLARRRALGRPRPRARQLGQLRPRRHRRVPQLPKQEDPQEGLRDALRPAHAPHRPRGREDARAHALGHARQQPTRRPPQPDRVRHRG